MTWQDLAERYELTPLQLQQLQEHYRLLIAANELFNITAITSLDAAIAYHYADSLELGKQYDLARFGALADVGTGGGFPGLVLKIKYPHLSVTLIEVSLKKTQFLEQVITQLGLSGITCTTDDWRTFLRRGTTRVDIVCARASLQPEELVRLFAPSCAYRMAVLVYWASAEWQPSDKVAPYIRQSFSYRVQDRERRYSVMQQLLPEER